MLCNGYVIFGVFNCVNKILDEVICVWVKVMCEVMGLKIVIKYILFDDFLVCDGLIVCFVV